MEYWIVGLVEPRRLRLPKANEGDEPDEPWGTGLKTRASRLSQYWD